MDIYDGNGNVIDVGVTTESVKNALIAGIASGDINIGAQIGATLSYSNIPDAWITNAQSAYSLMLAEYKKKPHKSIPFFISTDQHGNDLQQHRYINNLDKDGLEMASINLGDTVQDTYGDYSINLYYSSIKQVKNYIGVVGNHDAKYGSATMYELTLSRLFGTTNYQRINAPSKSSTYAVIDSLHAVKYIVLEDYYINAGGTGFTHGFDSETVDWLIDQLKDDSYDIILLMHWPSFRTRKQRGDSSESADTDRWDSIKTYQLWDFFVDRKLKRSGSYSDIDNQSHAYDFTGCSKDLLCALHGHLHSEYFSVASGLTAYASERYGETKFALFGLVDRSERLLKIWKFNTNSVYEVLELDI